MHTHILCSVSTSSHVTSLHSRLYSVLQKKTNTPNSEGIIKICYYVTSAVTSLRTLFQVDHDVLIQEIYNICWDRERLPRQLTWWGPDSRPVCLGVPVLGSRRKYWLLGWCWLGYPNNNKNYLQLFKILSKCTIHRY